MSISQVQAHPIQPNADLFVRENAFVPVAVSNHSLAEMVEQYKKLFLESENGYFPKLEKDILRSLEKLMEVEEGKYSNDIQRLSEIYQDSRSIKVDGHDEYIDDLCREGYFALRFYIKTIVDKVVSLHANIEDAKAALEAVEEILRDPTLSEEEKLQKAHALLDRLLIDQQFSDETIASLVKHHMYNNDTKQWEIIYDQDSQGKYFFLTQLKTYEDYDQSDKLKSLRETPIRYKDSRKPSRMDEGPIQVFSSLSLLDRLRYIRFYYKLILLGKDTRYACFPDDSEIGFPCLPNVDSDDPTKDTKCLGALEMFYVGHLTDRDGPINAVSSFFETKVQALRANIALEAKKIEALNVYLEFVNRGMQVLNACQSTATKENPHRICHGAAIALTCLCANDMYNLLEDDGNKYLVLQDGVHQDQFFLVKADEGGMLFLLGKEGAANNWIGDAYCYLADPITATSWTLRGEGHQELIPMLKENIRTAYHSTGKKIVGYDGYAYYDVETIPLKNAFKLPTKIDCAKVVPSSVKDFVNFKNPEKITTDVVASWTDALSSKTRFIDTTIDTINTDVQVYRQKIDSFDSICSTFRSKAQETYLNTLSNIK